MTNPDISLHGALHGTADAPVPDSAPGGPTPADPDISLHRAGLLPAEAEGRARGPAGVPVAPDRPFFPFFTDDDEVDADGCSAEEARNGRGGRAAATGTTDPEDRWTGDMPGAVDHPAAGR